MKLDAPDGEENVLDLTGADTGTARRLGCQAQPDGTHYLGEHARGAWVTRHNTERAVGGSECNAGVAAGESGKKEQNGRNSRDPAIAENGLSLFGRGHPIRHLRTGGNSGRNGFYAEVRATATRRQRKQRKAGHRKLAALAFLFGREDLGIGGFGGGGGGHYIESSVDTFGHRREADFGAAGLVAEFHFDVLGA